jgi:hypothetical protein
MPDEPTNQAEELLKRHAAQRRADAPDFSLHPATRRLLQGEVARQFPAAKPERRRSWLGFWGARFALASGIAAMLLGLGWFFWPSNERPMELASAPRQPAEVALPELRGAGGPLEAALSQQAQAAADAAIPTTADPIPAPKPTAEFSIASPSAPPTSLPGLAPGNRAATSARRMATDSPTAAKLEDNKAVADAVTRRDRNEPEALATAAGNAAPQEPAGQVAAAGKIASGPSVMFKNSSPAPPSRQYYFRAGAKGAPAEEPRSVLAAFAVEQQSNAIRLIDQDGSVYAGVALNNAATDSFAADARASSLRERAFASESETRSQQQSYNFRAAGSNVTLKQVVTVVGRVVPATNNPGRPPLSGAAGEFGNQVPAPPAPAPTNLVIEGTLQIGNGSQQFFRAVPAQQ